MSREAHVRFREKLRVKFSWLTRLVICCQYDRDAKRIKEALANRLAKYGLKMNEEKTKLVKQH